MNFSFYVHLINAEFKIILIKNDDDKIIQIFRNCRLKRMIELNFANVFQVQIDDDNDVAKLTIRKFFTKHKINWFKKIIVAAYAIIVVLTKSNLFSSVQSSIVVVSFTSFVFFLNMFFSTFVSIVSKIIFNNDIIIHQFNSVVVNTFTDLIQKYFNLWKNNEFAKLSKKHWMRILLKSNWEKCIFEKIKIYFLNTKNRELIDEIFDKLHEIDKFNWTKKFISFNYFVFCVWKTMNNEKKKRVVINIRELNVIIQFDVYFLSLQFEIISIVLNCQYITVIDCFVFFYQWRVHFKNRHKLTIVNHKKQKSFNVIVMKYKNSSTYVQR